MKRMRLAEDWNKIAPGLKAPHEHKEFFRKVFYSGAVSVMAILREAHASGELGFGAILIEIQEEIGTFIAQIEADSSPFGQQ